MIEDGSSPVRLNERFSRSWGGKTGGKAWFGGLACSGLAGYRAR
jgi:hypothetical protein